MADKWYALSTADTLAQLKVDAATGLSNKEVASRQAEHGKNELPSDEGTSLLTMFIDQFRDVTIILLIVAAFISIAIGEAQDSIVILAIVLLNALIGVYQERQAEEALAALSQLQTPQVRVRRNGHVTETEATELVPGDMVLLEAGSNIPADGRLIEAVNVKINESAMTGESLEVDKTTTPMAETNDAPPLAERHNMVYMGTAMTYGRAEMAVTETGLKTELGNIAALLQSVEQGRTPLQERLETLGYTLAALVVGICVIVFATGLLRGEDAREMFLTAVSLAVAAVPEGLPALITVSLALGANRMVKRNALIRKLPAVETLGSVTVICSDKTGTLTRNEMTATRLLLPDHADVEVQGVGYEPTGQFCDSATGQPIDVTQDPQLERVIKASALCSDAHLEQKDNLWYIVGDTTEGALLVMARKQNWTRAGLEKDFPRVGEIPFTSERKAMTTIHKTPPAVESDPFDHTEFVSFTKGAPDQMVEWAVEEMKTGQHIPLTPERRDYWQEEIGKLASQGMRVLGIAYRPLHENPKNPQPDELERNLILLGLVAIIDPPREEAAEAVNLARGAGIRPVMITGDHKLTALAIADSLGISSHGKGALTGIDLDGLSDDELKAKVKEVSVYARVSPEHKLRVVKALQANGEIAAMTGDGVNDAPALKQANIGVAMGITGTDVSKGAADMVLTDDNFASIVAAVKEGRTIYDNIRKFLRYLMGSNTGEVLTMFLGILLGFRLPLIATQILWINLVTDGLPAIALGFEKSEPGVMKRKPRPPKESIFAQGVGVHIIWVGLWMTTVSLFAYIYTLERNGGELFEPTDANLTVARTMAFTTLAMAQICHVTGIHAGSAALWQVPLWANPLLVVAVVSTVGLQLAVIYVPFMQDLLSTTALSAGELGLAFLLALSIIPVLEVEKALWRRRNEQPA